MFIATRASWAGIVFLLLTTWISGPRPTAVVPVASVDQDVSAVTHPNELSHDVDQMQQILLDKGHYRGKVDGVVGLRTRASLRAYQKAEHLQVTGQLDPQTADKLGVSAESGRQTPSATQADKPSAGIKRARSSSPKESRK